MPFQLTWLPIVLRNAGLKVAEVDGWPNRGRGDVGTIKGVMCHHTAGPVNGNMPSLGVLREGRSDLPGPLAQLGLGRDGTYYVIAAGRANHAGRGEWKGVADGNGSFIGIEAENTGIGDSTKPKFEPWPEVQLDAYRRGDAARRPSGLDVPDGLLRRRRVRLRLRRARLGLHRRDDHRSRGRPTPAWSPGIPASRMTNVTATPFRHRC